ncbi:MAG: GDSL-type esterase/lipase family protein [Bacteroidota bacterium]
MNKPALLFLVGFLSLGCTPKENTTALKDDENPAALAVKKEGEWWYNRHQTIVSRLSANPEMILIGNSIFQSLNGDGPQEVREKYLDQYRTVNMGISGDRTENVIWRLQNGALDNIQPKVAIILIGTNNIDGNHYVNISTPEELAGGIWRICEIVKEKLPHTKIILMGILPYGKRPNHRNNIIKATNSLISKFPEKNPHIHYSDIGPLYFDTNGMVRKELMPDFLHPNAEGLLLMFEALQVDIARLMAE